MSTAKARQGILVEDYLAGEMVAKVRHEYVAGKVFAMVGARNAHNIVAGNVFLAIGSQLKGQACQAFSADTKVRIRIGNEHRFYYPDAMIVCEPNSLSDVFQDRPVVIVEVLSESTRRTDLTEKLDAYQTIPTLTHYILLEQNEVAAIVYERLGIEFKAREFNSLDDEFDLPNVNVKLKLRDLYDRVILE